MDSVSLFRLALLCVFTASLSGFCYHYVKCKFNYNLERDFAYLSAIFALIALRYDTNAQMGFITVSTVFLSIYCVGRGLAISRKRTGTHAVIISDKTKPKESLTYEQIDELMKHQIDDSWIIETKQDGDSWMAKIKDDWASGSGKTMHEALGELLMRRRDFFKARIV